MSQYQTRASSAQADKLCQGRMQAQIGLPEVKSEDADYGNAIHAALYSGDDKGLDAQQLSISESCRDIEAKIVNQVFGADADKAKVIPENRLFVEVSIPGQQGTVTHTGQPDRIYRVSLTGLVVDYKGLPGQKQSAEENEQIRDYIVMAARKYIMTDMYGVIIQPLVTHSPLLVHYDEAAINQAEQEMFARVAASHAKNPPRTAGEIQCQFCRAKGVCDTYAKWVSTKLPMQVSIFDVPVALWTPEQCAVFCERMGAASKWLEETKSAMKERLKADPGSIPGWKLGEGSNREKVTDVNELHSRFIAAGGKSTDFLQCVNIVKKNFEMAVRGATGLKGKGLTGFLGGMYKGITESSPSEGSLERVK